MTTKFGENKFFQTINSIVKNRFIRQGLPMLILVVGGSFALLISQRIKVDYQREKQQIEYVRQSGLDQKLKPISLEDEYNKLEQVDSSTYQNVRGPRPYEDNSEWEAKKELQEKRFQKMLEKMKKPN